jgi:hypothetical protein
MIFLAAQVPAFAGVGVVGPGLAGTGVGDGGPGQGLPGGGERVAWRGLPGRGEQISGGAAPLINAADQDGQHRQPFPGPGVHACLTVPFGLAPVDLFRADRAGHNPLCPACRVLDGPVGQVEVEGPDGGQAFPVVDPVGRHGGGVPAVGAGDRSGHGPQPLFPTGRGLVGQVQALDARVMPLQVGPEQVAQEVREGFQAGVVQRGLAFPQVVHQQVADRAAGQGVSVDELIGCALPGGP